MRPKSASPPPSARGPSTAPAVLSSWRSRRSASTSRFCSTVSVRRARRAGLVCAVQCGRVNNDLMRPNGPMRHRTVSEIRAILSDHQLSGLSLVAFARLHQLCYTSLLRWRSRYSSEGVQTGYGLDPVAGLTDGLRHIPQATNPTVAELLPRNWKPAKG